MKKIYLSFLLPFAAIATCNAQQDMSFETGGVGANYVWDVFENDTNPPLEFVANPNPSGINTSATVAKFTAMVSGQRYAGTETSHTNGMADFVLDAEHSTIKIMVYKTVISPVGIKLVTQSNAALIEKKVSNTQINQWEELTFDFADYIGRLPDDNGMYDQIVVFPDFTDAPRTATNVIYFDNITFGESDIPNPPAVPMTAAPNPTAPQAQVISLYSNFYTNVPVVTNHAEWSTGGLEAMEIQGNATLKYTNLGYVGIETGNVATPNQIDITGMTHFNVNVWTPNATTLTMKIVDFGPNGVYNGPNVPDDSEGAKTVTAPAQGQWITYHIPIAEFGGLTGKQNVAQILFVSENNATVYVDNIYFSNDVVVPPTGPMTAAPDPIIAQEQVISLFSDHYTNNIPMATWRTSWSQANHEDVMIQGNTTKKYSALNNAGAEPVTQIDITGMTHFNFNVWSADFTEFRVKLVDFGANGQHNNETEVDDDVEHELTFSYTATDLNTWKTYHIAISDFTGLVTRGHIAQIIFSSTNGSTVYMDNIFFSTDTVNGVAGFTANNVVMYPNPVKDVLTIKGASLLQQVSVYNTLGQQVYTTTPNADTATINVSQLQNGVYIVNTLVDGITATQKFIKQ